MLRNQLSQSINVCVGTCPHRTECLTFPHLKTDSCMFKTSCFHRDLFFSDRRGLPIYRWIIVKFDNLLRDGSRLTDKELTEGGKEEWNHSTELERTSLIIIRLVSPSSGSSTRNYRKLDLALQRACVKRCKRKFLQIAEKTISLKKIDQF